MPQTSTKKSVTITLLKPVESRRRKLGFESMGYIEHLVYEDVTAYELGGFYCVDIELPGEGRYTEKIPMCNIGHIAESRAGE